MPQWVVVTPETRCCVKCTAEVFEFIRRHFDDKKVAFLIRKASGMPLADDPAIFDFPYKSRRTARFEYLSFVSATGQRIVFLIWAIPGKGKSAEFKATILTNLPVLYYAMAIGAFAIGVAGWVYHTFG
jgi:hypothetical protein